MTPEPILRLRGELIQPGDPEYDDARRIHNGAIDRRPALIARCLGVDDVIASVRYARRHDISLSVRGGGHGVAGFALNDAGLVIDLSHMRNVEVDAAGRRARVEGGATWGDVDSKTQSWGLATT